jgi:carboxymethylenebutenolidase
MCDDSTEESNKKWLAAKRLRRRDFSALSVGATAAALIPGCDSDDDPADDAGASGSGGSAAGGRGGQGGSAAGGRGGAAAGGRGGTPAVGGRGGSGDDDTDAGVATKAQDVEFETPDGKVNAYFVHPESGKAPAVIVWPDILGLREAFKTMGTRLAGDGYAVLVVNQYYRTSKEQILEDWAEFQSADGRKKLEPALAAITNAGIASDGGAFVEWLDKQDAVDTGKKIGSTGYCMGGPFTIRTAAAKPERVGAIGSFHGGSLVTDADDSPHKLFEKIDAALLIAIAQNDDEKDTSVKDTLKQAAEDAELKAEIEVYPAQHGWCAIDSAAYDEEEADRAYARLLAIFGDAL